MVRNLLLRLYSYADRAIFGILERLSLAPLYYSIFSVAFWREQGAVLSGRRQYFIDRKTNGGNEYSLRRNIHRLEKGLIAKPLRDVFATDYIGETVRLYAAALQGGLVDPATLDWAGSVLATYFRLAGRHPAIDRARAAFEAAAAPAACDGGDRQVPLPRSAKTLEIPSFAEFQRLALHRRSVRWYRPDAVPLETIDKAIEVAGLAPSACNRQPYRFYITQDRERIPALGAIPGGAASFIHQVPALAIVIGDLSAYCFEKDRHAIYIDGSLAAMSFMFALETLGLGSCAINWPNSAKKEKLLRSMIPMKPYEVPIMFISFGHADPDGLVPFSAKKSKDRIVTYA